MRSPVAALLRSRCLLCGTARAVSAHTGLCERCADRCAPSPVRLVLRALRITVRDAAQLTGLSERTISRAASGEPIGAAVAAHLGRALRIDPAVLIAGTAPPINIPAKEPRR